MFKATASNTFRPQQIDARGSAQKRLDLRGFAHVLEVHRQELWCDLEGSATFETFTAAALAAGLAPLVVPELRSITVAGAVVGMGVESSSFKHGFVHEGLLEADVLLSSGEVVLARPEGEHAELFSALPNSLGSLGYILRLRMRVQPAGPFVRVEKKWHSSPEALIEGLRTACSSSCDYVDAVALSATGGMVVTATFEESLPKNARVSTYGVWPVFYRSLVQEGVEHMATLDYLWRWDADWFWCTQIFPGLTSWLVRWLCGPASLRSDVYKAFNDAITSNVLKPLGVSDDLELIVQDIDVPVERSAAWIRAFLQVVPSSSIGKIKLSRPGLEDQQTVPLWLCPVKGTDSPLMPMKPGHLYINFGMWDALRGPQTQGGMEAGVINKALEQLCAEHEAKKLIYSSVFFSEAEFMRLYNGEHYQRMKQRYDPHGRLRGWYDRVTKA